MCIFKLSVRKLPRAVQWLLLSFKLWAVPCISEAETRDAVLASPFGFSLLQHPLLVFLVCFFSGDRWHLGELKASWWPARHTETWLMREASNGQKCEWCHHSFFLWGLVGFTVPLKLRWLLDLNNPSFHSSLPPISCPSLSGGGKPV